MISQTHKTTLLFICIQNIQQLWYHCAFHSEINPPPSCPDDRMFKMDVMQFIKADYSVSTHNNA